MRHLALLIPCLLIWACADESSTPDLDTTDSYSEPDLVPILELNLETEAPPEPRWPSDLGEACEEHDDCESTLCIDGGYGPVCSTLCIDVCPTDWRCRGLQAHDADVTFVCVQGKPETPQPEPGETACAAPASTGGEVILAESTQRYQDWPDCVGGCAIPVDPNHWLIDLTRDGFTAASGTFDAATHQYDFPGGSQAGPDIDIVALRAAPRTMLELAVLKGSDQSQADPLVYLSDGFRTLTFNSDVNPDDSCARTEIAFPYVSDLPIYVIIEEVENYKRYTPNGYTPGTVGGPGYDWLLRIRERPFEPTELGRIQPGTAQILPDEALHLGGQIQYYRFYAPGTARPTVRLKRTGDAAFNPVLVGLKSIEGEAAFHKVVRDSQGLGILELRPGDFRPCVPISECPQDMTCAQPTCSATEVEYLFAVFDFDGRATPAPFAYELEIQLD